MKRKPIIAVAVAIVAALAGLWVYRQSASSDQLPYRFATVERMDLESAVSATGSLSAVTTVQVGTQVSGRIVAIYADFNDNVKKGQLIARIDPVLQEQAVRDAEAGLERAQAELAQAQREYERNRQLFERKVLTEIEFENAQYALALAQANVKSARVTLDRARQNLEYTSIYAPIDGVVVERNVDVGQTVAASLQAPQLFLIANDLESMQILASVDESDIGLIREGQLARFTVQAYPDETFTGRVKQVRLQSTTTENVVSYTVVVDVENPAGKLLPGMTATVEFLTASVRDVLTVPNAALRFRPTQQMLAQLRAQRGANGSAAPAGQVGAQRNGSRQGGPPPGAAGSMMGSSGPPDGAAFGAGGQRSENTAVLWYVDEKNRLGTIPVRVGITDGQRTEVSGPGLEEGMRVIIGVTQSQNASGGGSPFQQRPPGGFRPGPPGGF